MKLNDKHYIFRTVIERDKPHGYHGFVPLLRGVHTFGRTLEETKENLREAIICHVQGLIKDKDFIPREENSIETIESISEKELVF